MMSLSPSLGSPYRSKELKSEERGMLLIHLLLASANYVAIGDLQNANLTLEQISQHASHGGDTMQRIASYFSEALADRILKAWPGIHKSLHSNIIPMVYEEIHVQKLFFELLPFLKLAYILTNQTIVEAMEGEKMVHVIDLNVAAGPTQWISLLKVLHARPGGPPHLRITGVHHQKEVLDEMVRKLAPEAERLDIPFQFNPVVTKLENLDFDKLCVKTGEALAISSILQLHSLLALDGDVLLRKSHVLPNALNPIHLRKGLIINQNTLIDLLEREVGKGYSPSPDTASASASASTSSSIESSSSSMMTSERFLKALWGLSPKVMVVTEQDSNHNGFTMMERLAEALFSYAAMFDCLESTVSRGSLDRIKVEKMLLGEEIKNIIACEGSNRKERHEKLERWIQRLDFYGFANVPISYYGMLHARRFLHTYGCEGYRLRDENGRVMLCWQQQSLFSITAWTPKK